MDTPFPTTDSMMYQTIHRQPQDLDRILTSGWSDAEQAAAIIAGAERIWITGIGTSYHAALVGEWLLRSTGKDVRRRYLVRLRDLSRPVSARTDRRGHRPGPYRR